MVVWFTELKRSEMTVREDFVQMIPDDQFSVVAGATTPKEIWDEKNEWFERAKQSKEYWDNNMADDQREAVVRIVKNGIERFHDRAEDWVPDALRVEGGQFLDITFRVLFTDIDKEIERSEKATSFQIREAQQGTAALLEDLGERDSDV